MGASKRPKMATGQLASGTEYYYFRKPARAVNGVVKVTAKGLAKDSPDVDLKLTRNVKKKTDAKTTRARKSKD